MAVALAWALVMAGAVTTRAQGITTLAIEPAELQLGVGQEDTLEVAVYGAANLYALEMQLTYDPAVLEVMDDVADEAGVQVTLPEDFLQPGFVVRNQADNERGSLGLAYTQLAPAEPANGDGVVATIRVRGKAAGEAAVRVASVILANQEAAAVPVTVQEARVRVGAGAAPTGVAPTASAGPGAGTDGSVATPTLPVAGAPVGLPPTAIFTPTASATAVGGAQTATPVPGATPTALPAQPTATPAVPAETPATAGAAVATRPAREAEVVAMSDSPLPAPAVVPTAAAVGAGALASAATAPAAEPSRPVTTARAATATATSTPVEQAMAAVETPGPVEEEPAPRVGAGAEPAEPGALGSVWVIGAVVGVLIVAFGLVVVLPRSRRGRA